MPVSIKISGDKEALKQLGLYQEGAAALRDTHVLVGTSVEYAIYQEEGTRTLRGIHYLGDALEAVTPRIGPAIEASLPKGAAAVRSTMHSLGLEVQGGAQQRAPVKTGNLRRSIHTVMGGRL